MKWFTLIVMLLIPTASWANQLTWIDNSDNEDGFIIEMLQGGVFAESARTPASPGSGAQYTYTDTNVEGVYQVRAFRDLGVDGVIVSTPTNKAGKLKGPIQLVIQ